MLDALGLALALALASKLDDKAQAVSGSFGSERLESAIGGVLRN
jgi:hypothetical protein